MTFPYFVPNKDGSGEAEVMESSLIQGVFQHRVPASSSCGQLAPWGSVLHKCSSWISVTGCGLSFLLVKDFLSPFDKCVYENCLAYLPPKGNV